MLVPTWVLLQEIAEVVVRDEADPVAVVVQVVVVVPVVPVALAVLAVLAVVAEDHNSRAGIQALLVQARPPAAASIRSHRRRPCGDHRLPLRHKAPCTLKR